MQKSLLVSQAVIFLSFSPDERSVPWDMTNMLDTPLVWAGMEKLLWSKLVFGVEGCQSVELSFCVDSSRQLSPDKPGQEG